MNQERNSKIEDVFRSNFECELAKKYFQECKEYVDILVDPEVKPWFPITEHAIYSIVDTAVINPALESNTFDRSKQNKAKKLESSIRDAIK